MANELTIVEEPLTAQEMREQVNRIQEVMKAVMQNGQHYGVIPGCGPKPTLLKPGAEKLMATFRLAIDPEVQDISDRDTRRYRIVARVTAQSNGRFLGAGVGECSSDEEKYAWREAVCKEEFDETDPVDRRNKWKKGKTAAYLAHQVRTNPADLANTILKMAKKRALVDAILTVTAASDIFTQDIEDLPDEVLNRTSEPKREDGPDQAERVSVSAEPANRDAPPPSHAEADLEILYQDLCHQADTFKTINEGNHLLAQSNQYDFPMERMHFLNKRVAARMKALRQK